MIGSFGYPKYVIENFEKIIEKMELPKTKTQFSTPLHIPICTFSFSKIKFVTVHIFQEVILANYRHQKCFYVLKIKIDQRKKTHTIDNWYFQKPPFIV